MSRDPEPRRPARAVRVAATSISGVLLLSAVLSGCVANGTPPVSSQPSTDTSTNTGASETPSSAPSATRTPDPTLDPEGTAQDSLPYFASVVARVWATDDRASGRAYIDALVAAGFDKAAMQVTRDESTVGNAAESIQFSVVWAGECLVGQVGPATGAPVAVVLPTVGDGSCLIGDTRPIDW